MITSSLDWEPSLKPRISSPMLDLGFLISPQDEAEDSLDWSSKRQHGDGTLLTPDISGTAATGDVNPEDKVCFLTSV